MVNSVQRNAGMVHRITDMLHRVTDMLHRVTDMLHRVTDMLYHVMDIIHRVTRSYSVSRKILHDASMRICESLCFIIWFYLKNIEYRYWSKFGIG